MLCAPSSCERLCWRSWPCPACSGGQTPVGFLLDCADAGKNILFGTPEEVAQTQSSLLIKWAMDCGHNSQSEVVIPRIAEGSEHIVLFQETSASVLKYTRKGVYGEMYYLNEEGRVNQQNCSPLDYLIRLRLWKKLFGSAPKDLGITKDGQIVSSSEFIVGSQPDQNSVDSFLENAGLVAVKQNCWLWKKGYKDFEIWVGDARIDNFVQTSVGIVPIDIRIWFVTTDNLRSSV